MNFVIQGNSNIHKFIYNEYSHANIEIVKGYVNIKPKPFVFRYIIEHTDATEIKNSFHLSLDELKNPWIKKRFENFYISRDTLNSPFLKLQFIERTNNITGMHYRINDNKQEYIPGNIFTIIHNLIPYKFIYLYIDSISPVNFNLPFDTKFFNPIENKVMYPSDKAVRTLNTNLIALNTIKDSLEVELDIPKQGFYKNINQSFFIEFKTENGELIDIESFTLLLHNKNNI